jgi:hypothetical protein
MAIIGYLADSFLKGKEKGMFSQHSSFHAWEKLWIWHKVWKKPKKERKEL